MGLHCFGCEARGWVRKNRWVGIGIYNGVCRIAVFVKLPVQTSLLGGVIFVFLGLREWRSRGRLR